MTKAELNQVLLDGITQSIQADKTLPENLADRYVDWIHGLIKQGQAKQMQKANAMPKKAVNSLTKTFLLKNKKNKEKEYPKQL